MLSLCFSARPSVYVCCMCALLARSLTAPLTTRNSLTWISAEPHPSSGLLQRRQGASGGQKQNCKRHIIQGWARFSSEGNADLIKAMKWHSVMKQHQLTYSNPHCTCTVCVNVKNILHGRCVGHILDFFHLFIPNSEILTLSQDNPVSQNSMFY